MEILNGKSFINPKDMEHVENFAMETGDAISLSLVDKMVMAAGITLSREKNEYIHVMQKPKDLTEFRPRSFKPYYEDEEDNSSDEQEQKAQEVTAPTTDDDWNEVSIIEKKNGKKVGEKKDLGDFGFKTTGGKLDLFQKHQAKIDQMKALMADSDDEKEDKTKDADKEVIKPAVDIDADKLSEKSDEYDNEEEGGAWITKENLYSNIGGANAFNLMATEDNLLFAGTKNVDEDTKDLQGKDEQEGENVENTTATASEVDNGESKPEVVQTWIRRPNNNLESNIKFTKFITSDFAMQNVIIQMGFQLLNLDGMRLTRVKRFKLLCQGCKALNMDTERLFCNECGGAFLKKVSVYLNNNGEVTYFVNPKRRINNRGKVFSIPKPVGGRGCKDMILREDDLLNGEYATLVHKINRQKRQEIRTINDTLDGNYWAGGEGNTGGGAVSNLLYDNGARGGKTTSNHGKIDKIVIGYGKKNPNVPKKKY